MIDEGRWLRPDRRLAWRDLVCSVAVSWSIAGAMIASLWAWSPSLPTAPLMFLAGLVGGVFAPLGLIGLDERHRSVRRGEAWLVGPKGVAIWRRGAVVHLYPWSEIRDAGGASDQIRIVLRNVSREHRLDFQRSSEVQWFRESARDRVVERLEGVGSGSPD